MHVALVFPLDQRFAFEVLAVDGNARGFDPEPFVPLLALQFLRRIEFQVAASQIVGDGLFVFWEGRWPRFVVIPQRRWFRKLAIGKEGFVLQIRIPLAMRCFVVEHQEEGLVFGSGLEELDPELGCDLRTVPFDGEFFAWNKKLGVPVGSLTGQDDPTIESSRVASQMPLADHPGVVASGLQMLGDVVPCPIEAVEDRDSVLVGVLPGQKRRAARGADGIGDKRIQKPSPLSRQSIQMWGSVDLGPIRRDRSLGMVVREDEKDVGPLVSKRCRVLGKPSESEQNGNRAKQVPIHRRWSPEP